MAKKEKVDFALLPDENVSTIDLAPSMNQFMISYSGAANLNRSVPNIDGLKPVHRRILYTMWKQRLYDGKATKLNNVGGYTMLLHPHGDPSPSAYTLGARWQNNVPLIKIIGNGGTINRGVEDAAAPRYTSATLTDDAVHILAGLTEHAAELKPSYDGEREEPKLLPTEYPLVWMNRTLGMGEGLKTDIYPHNPREINEALIYYIDHPKMSYDKLGQIVQGPDFPTAGLLVNSKQDNLNELKTGKAKFTVRSKVEVEAKKSAPMLRIVSIPVDVTVEKLIKELNDFMDSQNDYGIREIIDESSDYNQIDIQVLFKRGVSEAQLEQVLALLYQETSLEVSINAQNIVIDNEGHPNTLGLLQYFDAWLAFRKDCLKRQYTYRLNKDQERLEIVQGLLKLNTIADQVVAEAKRSQNKKDFEQILQTRFGFTIRQSEAIASMALYRLGRQDVQCLQDEQAKLKQEVAWLKTILASDAELMVEIKHQLQKLNRTIFKDCQRVTELVEATKVDQIEVDKTKLVKKQDVIVTAKADGQVQRMSQQIFDNRWPKFTDKDQVVNVLRANTQQGILGFLSSGQAFFRLVNNLDNQPVDNDVDSAQLTIPAYKRTDKLLCADNPNLTDESRYIVSVSKYGQVKLGDERKVIPNYNTRRYLKRLMTYNGLKLENDEVIFVQVLSPQELDDKTLTITRDHGRGKVKKIKLSEMHVQGATGSGTREVKASDENPIIDIEIS